eukprot:TRINITY_DN4993_c0_g1_i2.p1 TRINITY_DN4993_c0_g1~~TRINITY_DN4993_c0_g1_i2.p1  ORF type:complete len:285 (+),score=71.93 TRINITY_DN4993_c0_g1_i2:149-1003(+)
MENMQPTPFSGSLKMQGGTLNQWTSRHFVLENGCLDNYSTASQVKTQNRKRMEIRRDTVATYTNTLHVFCVRTDQEKWFLQAEDDESMNEWMAAINAVIHSIYVKTYKVPADDYWCNDSPRIREFLRMVDDSPSQWIRAFPESDAPRTGEGLFAGNVIEVVQKLTKDDTVYLRLADKRGWTILQDPETGSVLFEAYGGEITPNLKTYAIGGEIVTEPVAILFGPTMDSQPTGDTLKPDEQAKACELFVPQQPGSSFIKLTDGRGWMPVRRAQQADDSGVEAVAV